MKKIVVLLIGLMICGSAMAAGMVNATWDGEARAEHEQRLPDIPREAMQITVNLGEPIAFHTRFYVDCCEPDEYQTLAFRLSEEETVQVIYFMRSGLHTCVIDGVYADVWVKPSLEIQTINGPEMLDVISTIWE